MADILENPVDLIDDAYEQEIQVEQEMIEVVAYRSYNQLDDKPQINGVELAGNKTSSDLGITAQIESAINSEAQARAQADNTLQGKIDTEKLARQQADSTLQGNIDAEETARKASDKDIQDVLDGETLARQNADIALGGHIDTEIHDRQVADIGLQGQIDAITSKSDVVDVVATYADLQAYDTQHLGDNDVIKVLDDETHGDALTYYRWSKTNQTWTFIGQEAPYYSKSQTDTLLLAKQNTIDSSHKLSADLVDDTNTTNKFVTASDITNWNAKQDALTAGTGIDITDGVISTPAIVPEVVTELPTTGAEGKLYLTPKAHTTQTATGNPITATVAEEAGKIESFQLDGDTFQQSYTGKNLIATTRIAAETKNGVTCTWEGSSFTLNGTSTASADFYGRGWWGATSDPIALPAGTYTISLRKSDGSLATDVAFSIDCYYGTNHIIGIYKGNSGAGYLTKTFDSDTQYAVLYISLPSGRTYNNEKFYVQLEKSESPTAYEPFVGGQPIPSPEYPQPIQTVTGEQTVTVAGKNLFDKTKDTAGGYLDSSGGSVPANNWNTSGYIKVAPGENYTISGVSTPGISPKSCYYNSSKQFVSSFSNGNQTITIPSGVAYLRLSVFDGKGGDGVTRYDSNTLQLEKGTTATAYAPYHATGYPLNLGSLELCKLGTYQDYIWKDGEDWKVHKEISSITLDGTEGWVYASNYNYARCPSYTFVDKPIGGTGLGLQLSNCFGVITDWGTFRDSTSRNAFFPLLDEGYKISIRNTGCTSTEDYTSWLSTNKPSFYYPIETPTDTTITDTTLIAQLEAIRTASLENGTNTITNTATGTNLAGDMEIGYFGFNPTNRYDKFIWLDLNNNYEQIGGE